MKALSIRQPWAWAILHAGKRIENRQRRDGQMPDICRHRGPLLLHASAGMTRRECVEAFESMQDIDAPLDKWPGTKRLQRGGIVGRCNAIACIDPQEAVYYEGGYYSDGWALKQGLNLDWWAGGYALILADVEPTPFVECKGSLGLWTVPADVLRRLERT